MATNIIKELKEDADFTKELSDAGSKLVVVDFTASWCGPCQRIAPIFKELSTKYPNAVYLKVDVDELQETAANNGVRSMPTFILFKNSQKLDQMSGADSAGLEALIKKHHSAKDDEEAADGSGVPGYSKPIQSA